MLPRNSYAKLKDLIKVISKEELYNYYIIENHTREELKVKYNLTIKMARKLIKYYGIEKSDALSAKNAARCRLEKHPSALTLLEASTTEEEFYKYYIEENHSVVETAEKFNSTISGVHAYIVEHNFYKSVEDKLKLASDTLEAKYGCRHNSQIPFVKESKAKNTYKYKYNGVKFDSSWEIAYYIWRTENNLDVHRCTDCIPYTYNNKEYTYTPDFIVNNRYIEVKGNYMYSKGKLLAVYSSSIQSKLDAKTNCMLDNNVEILFKEDILHMIKYCEEKFNNKYWYRQFRVKKI